ncbi:MAG: hypothetical protein COX62_01515 [Deltaproteobacteria bacterium CG_4_10_14_0_2_um_filter_43_8]|nr:MAG: hypothetical protein COV43_06120 [Deltaproteobacteria bacterium CG11_big_fil_rev_8_21_14_0_20_42_23]PJA21753.1 MAG: hypothetical protein COX62_01515 [Deltaproteobacteria bacterium CG_4_10_14_0_2_um_filter_43_8]PJC65168.1 MAG: hypothetical protein CO021_00515 [Deltaproteobacteria bacterium CG_4_9_14_0_2_um_filter_42_21]
MGHIPSSTDTTNENLRLLIQWAQQYVQIPLEPEAVKETPDKGLASVDAEFTKRFSPSTRSTNPLWRKNEITKYFA